MSRHARQNQVRAVLGLTALAAVAIGCCGMAGRAYGQPTVPTANPPVVFAQGQSDLAADPAARFGRLPNGMTYVIYKNKTPPGSAAVWMRIAAGSVMEQEDQRGLAHFIEHMAFNGSKNVREGEMVKLLERHGLAFGADTNAQTSDLETVYMLNLPDANAKAMSDVLFLMRETAGNLLFDPAAIDRERGVILGEERARASMGMQAYEGELKLLFAGTKHPERLPIGLIDVIKHAQRPAFLRFYNDFYRPEYATLIVVGDVDPDRIESDIRRRFADWRPGPQSPAGLTDYGTLTPRSKPEAKVFVADGLNASISVSWVKPDVDMVETKAKDMEDSLLGVASAVLSERYSRAANEADSAIAGASFEKQEVKRAGQVFALNIQPRQGQDRAAFVQAVMMLRTFVANGPTEAELQRALLRLDRVFSERVAAARTMPTQAIAEQILKAVSERGVLQSPAQELAEFRELRPSLTVSAIIAAMHRIPLSDPPIIWRQAAKADSFDEAAILEDYRTTISASVQPRAASPSVVWPYTSFGKPGVVVARDTISALGATRIRFANGTILLVKPTTLEDNAVQVAIQVGDGLLGVPAKDGAALFMAKQVGLFEGGLGKLSVDDMREALAGKVYGLGLTIGANATVLNGATSRADLGTQLQLFAAFMTDPGFRADRFDRVRAMLPASYDDARVAPDGVWFLKAEGDVYGDDPRFSTPTQQEALAVGNDLIVALLKRQLGLGPVEITIVGDIDVAEAIQQVGATFGALPARPAMGHAGHGEVIAFPRRDLHRIYYHDGRADQNISAVAWPTVDFYSDPKRAVTLELLAAIMTDRELDEIREKQGASYSASVRSSNARYFPGFGFMLSRAQVSQNRDEAFYRTVSDIARALAQKPVTKDELSRVRAPLLEHIRSDRNNNGFWLGLLSGASRDPLQIATQERRQRDLLSITPADIRNAAATYLDMNKALRLQVAPRPAGTLAKP